MTEQCRITLAVAVALLAAASPAVAAEAEADLQVAIDRRVAANEASVASQKRIDDISDETEAMLTKYRAALKQLDSLNVYNGQMQDLIAAQEEERESLQAQLDDVELVARAVSPLMTKMIAFLESFVELDVPFLVEERTRRIAELKEMMNRSDVSTSEKYRRIMEAYQIENEYGRTIEAYRSTIENSGEPRTVDFLRIGRVALVYQTLEGEEAGAWDQRNREWVLLDSSFHSAIEQGLRVARKQSAPELIRVPVPVAEHLTESN